MWDAEKKHIDTFDKMIHQHRVRPTLLYPLAQSLGWALGASTALMGREAAMACTEAVETVIGEHYDEQVSLLALVASHLYADVIDLSSSQIRDLRKSLPADHPSIPLLERILEEFRDDELEHLDTAVENDAQKAPAHALLSAVVAGGCRVAIGVCERI
jgi:ubiquinone biosynthesis monooxygenase Coq7